MVREVHEPKRDVHCVICKEVHENSWTINFHRFLESEICEKCNNERMDILVTETDHYYHQYVDKSDSD